MVKFSKELSVVLSHDNLWSHLNAKGETIDKKLEKKGYAREVLAKIWCGVIIDGYPVLVEFISEEVDQEVIKKAEEWKSKYVRKSQYFLQIVKCKDSKCCSPFHSSCLKWVKWDVDAHYLFLTQNLALKAQLAVTALKNFLKGIPCDYSCPAAQKHNRETIVI